MTNSVQPHGITTFIARPGATAPGTPLNKRPTPTTVLEIQANVDDLDPRLWPGVIDALIDAGAVDAWLTPIIMKKGRPAHTVSALAPENAIDQVVDALFAHTTTIGVRINAPAHRRVLARTTITVTVDNQAIRAKISGDGPGGTIRTVNIEFDDIKEAAKKLNTAEKNILITAQTSLTQEGYVNGAPWPKTCEGKQ